jgi:hypothetical protein
MKYLSHISSIIFFLIICIHHIFLFSSKSKIIFGKRKTNFGSHYWGLFTIFKCVELWKNKYLHVLFLWKKKSAKKEFTKNQETYAVKKTLPKYYGPSNSKDNFF